MLRGRGGGAQWGNATGMWCYNREESMVEVGRMAQAQIVEGTGEELIELLYKQPTERFRLIQLSGEREFQTYEEALARATTRSTNEIVEARVRLLQASPPPRELPEGKTLEDVVLGQWPGNETDEQILEVLEKLS